MSELYENFMPVLYKADTPREYYAVRFFKMDQRKSSKIFSIKKYGSRDAAEEAAWEFFCEKYNFRKVSTL